MTHLLNLFIFLLISSVCSASSSNKPSNCIKNSTTNSFFYPPYFKTKRICSKQLHYTLIPFGHQFQFDCTYDSNPAGTVVWYKSKVNDSKSFSSELLDDFFNSTKLTIKSVSLNNVSHYTCVVFNNYGSIHHSILLDVSDIPLVQPIFKHKEEEFYAMKGANVQLDCSYKTDEFSDLRFYRANSLNNYSYDELISLNDKENRAENVLNLINSTFTFDQLYHLQSSSFYHSIDNLTDDQFGIYMCIGENRYGKSVKFMKLIQKRPQYNFFILLYIISSTIVILMILLIFQAYLRTRDKKKFMIEKSYIIKKKIKIDYEDAHGVRLSDYKNCPGLKPCIQIIKESKEITGKVNHELNSEWFEIDFDQTLEIDRNRLRIDKTIGEGNFGVVQRAYLYSKPLTSIEKPIYVNDNVFSISGSKDRSKKSNNYSSIQYTNTSISEMQDYNSIRDHFENNNLNNNIVTAFSNNYYGLQELDSYGRLDLKLNTTPAQLHEQGRIVAVKRLKDDYSENDIKDLIYEMVMMKLFGKDHENIINLIGTCTQDGPIYVIMEYAEKGNLKDFLKKYRINNCYLPSSIPNERLTSRDLISFAKQIAKGMHHLASHNCIHNDLAARNVLVTSNLTMKIADFGLSRNTGDSEYYRKSSNSVVPIKWLAPECIIHQRYTVQTDVWSYGVLLWELTSLGSSPYENINSNDIFLYLKAGKRMSRPLWCNEDLYKLMLQCWSWDSKDRPSFEQIIQYLELIEQNESPNNYVVYQDMPTPESSINSECEYLR